MIRGVNTSTFTPWCIMGAIESPAPEKERERE